MTAKKAFLIYLGNRKWRKVRGSKISAGRDYLRYKGSRKWKKAVISPSSNSKELQVH